MHAQPLKTKNPSLYQSGLHIAVGLYRVGRFSGPYGIGSSLFEDRYCAVCQYEYGPATRIYKLHTSDSRAISRGFYTVCDLCKIDIDRQFEDENNYQENFHKDMRELIKSIKRAKKCGEGRRDA